MSQQLNFKELKERITIVQCAEYLELALKEETSGKGEVTLRCKCPKEKCGGDERSFSIRPEDNRFKCYASNVYGSIIDMVMHVKDISMRQTQTWLNEKLNKTPEETVPQETGQGGKPEPVVLSPLESAPKLNPHASAVSDLGLDPDVAELVGVGLGANGTQRGFVAVLLYDQEELREHGIMPVGTIGIPKGTAVKLPKNMMCFGGDS